MPITSTSMWAQMGEPLMEEYSEAIENEQLGIAPLQSLPHDDEPMPFLSRARRVVENAYGILGHR